MTRSHRLSTSLLALQVTAFVVAPLLLLFAYLSQSTIREFRRNGVPVDARVVHKWERSSEFAPYCIQVSFFDKSILEGGTLYMPEICELVSGPVWASYEEDDRIEVVVLETDKEKAILLDSMDPANLAPIHKYVSGLVALSLGIALAGLRALANQNRSDQAEKADKDSRAT